MELPALLDTIYSENPKWWPYGLYPSMFDYLQAVEDPETQETVGFVGWQFRYDPDGRRIGYYAVGILPGFRRKGLAGQAVKQLIANRPGDVAAVRAFIVPGNQSSMALAAKLQVPVQHKSASLQPSPSSRTVMDHVMPAPSVAHILDCLLVKQAADMSWVGPTLRSLVKPVLWSAAMAGGMDYLQAPDGHYTDMTEGRLKNMGLNFLLSGGGMLAGARGAEYMGMNAVQRSAIQAQRANRFNPAAAKALTRAQQAALPTAQGIARAGAGAAALAGPGTMLVKDLARSGVSLTGDVSRVLRKVEDGQLSAAPAASPASSSFQDMVKLIKDNKGTATVAGLGALGAVGAGGWALHRGLQELRDAVSRGEKGRIRVTLPTRNAGDAETQLDLPLKGIQMSDALYGRLGRDFRSRLHQETKERTRKVTLSPEEKARRAARLALYRDPS